MIPSQTKEPWVSPGCCRAMMMMAYFGGGRLGDLVREKRKARRSWPPTLRPYLMASTETEGVGGLWAVARGVVL